MAIIEARELTKTYDGVAAVSALDLDVEAGEILGLLGPNGAGKTTAISMICGVLTPTRGEVRIAGHDLARESFAARRQIGLVPQDLALYQELTARQNLRFFGRAWGLRGRELAAAIDRVLALVELGERADESVKRFSGGMKRRLNIAAGILHEPRVLVLDEPTVGVDPQSRAHIFDKVRELRQERGVSVVYTSHYMEEVQALCDRVAILDHGKLIALDTMEDLVRRHAPGGLELEVEGNAARVEQALAELGAVSRKGDRLVVGRQDAVGDIVRRVEGCGARLRSLRTLEPDLEAVFLELTGRSLRDGP